MEKRKNGIRSLATTLLAVGLSLGAAGTAMAAVVSAGGGTWDYGVTSLAPSNNWSNYWHPSRVHGSSVGGDSGVKRSSCVGANRWSRVTNWDSNPFRIDHAYWRYC